MSEPICDNEAENTPEEEEDLVDPHETLRESCKKKPDCAQMFEKLTACNDRVNSRTKTAEICAEELIDFVECVDSCAAKTLFQHLK